MPKIQRLDYTATNDPFLFSNTEERLEDSNLDTRLAMDIPNIRSRSTEFFGRDEVTQSNLPNYKPQARNSKSLRSPLSKV